MKNSNTFLLCVTPLGVSPAGGQQAPRPSATDNGLVIERKIYSFPSYGQAVQTTDVEKNVPILIMHGGSDRSVNASQSLALAQQLQKQGKTYELIVYAQDNHFLSANQDDRDRRALNWFKRYMKQRGT